MSVIQVTPDFGLWRRAWHTAQPGYRAMIKGSGYAIGATRDTEVDEDVTAHGHAYGRDRTADHP